MRYYICLLYQVPHISTNLVKFIGPMARVIYRKDDWLLVESDGKSPGMYHYAVITPGPDRLVPWAGMGPCLPDSAVNYVTTQRLINAL